MRVRKMRIGVLAAMIGLCGSLILLVSPSIRGAQAVPHYKVDTSWPKPLPNKWMLANAPAMAVDKNDHIWIMNRPRQLAADDADAAQTPPAAECCVPAPSIIEFDAKGDVLKSFGGPNYLPDWPTMEHGLFIDGEGNFWIGGNYAGGNGNGLTGSDPETQGPDPSAPVLKLSPQETKCLEIGHPSAAPMNNQDTSIPRITRGSFRG